MRTIGKISLLCCCAALLACSISSENKGGSAAKNPTETAYISESATSEDSISSGEGASSSSEVVTPSSESSDEITQTPSWTFTSDVLKETKESTYLNDVEFTVANDDGNLISFYGDYVQRGHGEFAGMIQMKKGGDGLIECKSLLNGNVALNVYKKITNYNGEDHDFTGIPDFYVSSDLANWSAVEGSKKDGSSGNLLYTFKVTHAYFKFTTKTSNALYLNSVSFYSSQL